MLLLGVVGSFEPKLKHGKRANKKKKKTIMIYLVLQKCCKSTQIHLFYYLYKYLKKKKESVEGLQGECTPGTSTQEKRKTKQMQALIRQSCCLELTLKRLISVDASRRGQKEKN
jgi:hypothetical protein